MKILDELLSLIVVFFLFVVPVNAASKYGKSSADMVYQSRVGPNSQSAKEERALLKDLTRYDPYMKDQFIPSSSISGSDSGRSRNRVGYQMEKLESLNSGELTPEQYRATMQDFIHSRERTPQVKMKDNKYGTSIQLPPVNPVKPTDSAVKKTSEKEKKKSEFKNPIDEYLDKLAEKQDKAKATDIKNSAGAAKEENKKTDASAVKPAEKEKSAASLEPPQSNATKP